MIPARLWAPPTLNPITKLAITVAVSTTAFAGADRVALYPSMGLAALVVLVSGIASGSIGPSIRAIAVAAAAAGIELWGSGYQFKGLLALVMGFLNTGVRMLPAMLLGYWLAVSVRVGDFLASADRCGLPRVASIPIAVALRYLPTIAAENGQIRMAMKTRGIRVGVISFLKNPMAALETSLIPLLLRSATVADELAASALTRGLDSPGKRTHARPPSLGAADLFAAGGTAAFVMLVAIARLHA